MLASLTLNSHLVMDSTSQVHTFFALDLQYRLMWANVGRTAYDLSITILLQS
jgi:hypothetical protein